MANHQNSAIEASDFERDAAWYFARAWRGVVVVIAAVAFVLLMFNVFAHTFREARDVYVLGRRMHFPSIPFAVKVSWDWIGPMLMLAALIVLNRAVGLMSIRSVKGAGRKRAVFDAFVYSGEALSLLALKFSGGVESPMYLYFLGHLVALSSVVQRRTLAKHILFLAAAFTFMAVGEYTGFIPHTNYLDPPVNLYRSPAYVYIITLGVIAYMTYMGLSFSNVYRKLDERQQALKRAEQSSREADLYLDLMAHDLMNYNQTMMGHLGLLERVATPEEKLSKRLGVIKRQIHNSNRLISLVKAFSEIRDLDRAALTPVDLNRCMEDAVSSLRNTYGPDVAVISFEPEGDKLCMASPLLESVFMNVIQNAVKHAGMPVVKIEVDIDGELPDAWEVTIRDNGPGIPDEMKEKIFERFTQLGNKQGSGLGLTLARSVLDKYGGRIMARDAVPGDPGKGSAFVIHIPKDGV